MGGGSWSPFTRAQGVRGVLVSKQQRMRNVHCRYCSGECNLFRVHSHLHRMNKLIQISPLVVMRRKERVKLSFSDRILFFLNYYNNRRFDDVTIA